jgi:membrane-bound lytic murein transglycosylase D
VGEARFFALAEAGVIAAETRNYVPQLIAAALVGKEAARHGITVRREEPLAYDEVRVPGLTPLAAVAEATGSTRAELLDLNPHLLRGVTPPGGSYLVRVPEGAGEGAAAALAELPAEARRAFRRLATKKREPFAALADRAGVPEPLLRAYNPGLETVSGGKYRGRLVSGQAVRVPTAAALAYARPTPTFGAPGALPALPAPPPEPKPAKLKAAKVRAAEGAADAADRADRSPDEPRSNRRGTAAGKPARDESAADEPVAPKPGRAATKRKDSADEGPAKPKSAAGAPAASKAAGKTAAAKAAKSAAGKSDAGKPTAGKSAAKAPTKEQSAKKAGRRG